MWLSQRENRCSENLPEKFWSEKDDDSKPDYLKSIIYPGKNGKGEEKISHSDLSILDFEKFEKKQLKKALQKVYQARSRLVHEGIRFPGNIILGHFSRIPIGVVTDQLNSPFHCCPK